MELGPEVEVRSPDFSALGDTSRPESPALGALRVWEVYGPSDASWEILGQVLGSSGLPAGESFRVNEHSAGPQQAPVARRLSDGGFLVVWESLLPDDEGETEGWEIVARRFDPAGRAIGGDFRVSGSASGDQRRPRLVEPSPGELWIVWECLEESDESTGWMGRVVRLGDAIFADDFESGDVVAWSVSVSSPEPIFFATPPEGEVGVEVVFDAQLSFDGDGVITSYTWDFGDGQGASGASVSHAYSNPGDFSVVLTLGDDDGLTSMEVQDFTVQPPNTPPIASFSVIPGVGLAPLGVFFDASTSSDADGTIASYTWDFGDGDSAEGATAFHLFEEPGSFTVTLTVVDDDGVDSSAQAMVTAQPPPAALASTSPVDGEQAVAVTRETVLRFTESLDPTSVSASSVSAEAAGMPLPLVRRLSADGKTLTLFYDALLPTMSEIVVTVDGDLLLNLVGDGVDADGDFVPGGVATVVFETVDLAIVPGTVTCGRVLASDLEQDSEGNPVEVPLAGVTVSVDGAADTLFATTDANGNYCLDPSPGARFFVHIDGATATNTVPEGAYYPTVGKAFEPEPGLQTHVGNSYLPLIAPDTLQAVSDVEETVIGFPASVIAQFPELAGTELRVPAGSLFDDDGTSGGLVGLAPVPPDRLPGSLPQGLEFPVVVTVQTDGPSNFDTPAPICLPNLPHPTTGDVLAPGASSALMSFNHDSGRWEVSGSMTVTVDGALVCSDAGVGIRAPGWHAAQPLNFPTPVPKPDPPCMVDADTCIFSAGMGAIDCVLAPFLGGLPIVYSFVRGLATGAIGCIPSLAQEDGKGGDCLLQAATLNTLTNNVLAQRWISRVPYLGPVLQCGLGVQSAVGACTCLLETGGEGGDTLSTAMAELGAHLDLIEQQKALYALLLGSEVWTDLTLPSGDPRADADAVVAILTTAADATDGDSDGGGLITASEAVGVRALPRPAGIEGMDVDAMIDYINLTTTFWQQGILTHAEAGQDGFVDRDQLETAVANFEAAIDAIEAMGLPAIDLEGAGENVRSALVADLGDPGLIPFDRSDLMFVVTDHTNGTVSRGRLAADGRFNLGAIRDNSFHEIGLLHPASLSYGSMVVLSGEPGGETEIPKTLVYPSTDLPDQDADGLADAAEFLVGTNPSMPDTDGDGVNDGDEVTQGTDPLGRDIQIGEVITGEISTGGELDRYAFPALAGQRVFFDLQDGSTTRYDWRLEDEDGVVVFDRALFGDAGTFELSRGGLYTLTLGDPGSSSTGSYQFQLWNVPAPDTFAIALGDVVSEGIPGSGAGNIETPGREDVYTFVGTAGQTVFADLLGGSTTGWDWILTAPDDTVVFDRAFFGDAGSFVLPLSGTYTLTLGDPNNDQIGTYSFQILDVPAPDQFVISISDVVSEGVPGPGAGNIESPGRLDIYTFTGTAGQTVFGDILAGSTTGWDWVLTAPDDTVVFDRAFFGDAGSFVLPLSGTYTLTLGDPNNDQVGTYSFQILDVPAADQFAISIGDVVSDGVPAPGAGNIESPGRLDVYTFTGTAGQTIFGDILAGSTTGWDWILTAPDDTVVFDRAFFGDAGSFVLPLSGTYTLTLGDPNNDQVGTYSFQITDVSGP